MPRAPVRDQLIQTLIETRGRPFVDALAESGLLAWLEHHQARLTAPQITAQLRRLPPAVILRARAHMQRRQREGAAHRCSDCAVPERG